MQQSRGWIDRQMPQGAEVFLDHVGYFVADLEPAGEKLSKLGFQVSQINVQTNADAAGELHPSGTSNRLARLRRGYLEVLAATHDTPLAEQFREAHRRYEGLHLIALCRDDIPAERARLTAAGFAMQPIVHLKRRDKTLPGAPEVAWSVLRPEPDVMPEGRIQYAKSHNPDLVWQPAHWLHANRADALTDILLCVEARRTVGARYEQYVGRPVVDEGGFGVMTLDRGRLLFAEPETLAHLTGLQAPALPYMAGQALRSADIAATRAVLVQNAVTPLYADAGLILIGPADALGSALLFHAAAIEAPWIALAERLKR
jgi:hypothetical protein